MNGNETARSADFDQQTNREGKRMRRSVSVAVVAVLLSFARGLASQTQELPTVLKCTTDRGEAVADLRIDLAKRELRWGSLEIYDIIHISAAFITAYERPSDNVGGEV